MVFIYHFNNGIPGNRVDLVQRIGIYLYFHIVFINDITVRGCHFLDPVMTDL